MLSPATLAALQTAADSLIAYMAPVLTVGLKPEFVIERTEDGQPYCWFSDASLVGKLGFVLTPHKDSPEGPISFVVLAADGFTVLFRGQDAAELTGNAVLGPLVAALFVATPGEDPA
ncbi:hypothetical protein [Roseomonas sp. WA12]